MTQDTTSIQAIETLIGELLPETEDIFLVSVRIKPTNNIKVFLDADSGLSIENCVRINRAMYRTLEEKGWYPDGNFSLEVSSPGLEEPLKMLRQYKKNIGRKVAVILTDDSIQEGKLLEANDKLIQLEYTEGKNKKAVTIVKEIPFDQIKQTTMLIAF
ncbi:MAG: ribosome maturation factor [Ferruginibacter sp.]|nr:ribosome maturation factor [Ferruginibacter sp.]